MILAVCLAALTICGGLEVIIKLRHRKSASLRGLWTGKMGVCGLELWATANLSAR